MQTTWYPALHQFSDYRRLMPGLSLPRVEEAADRHCALPMSSTMGRREVEIVLEAVEASMSGSRARAVV